MGKPTIDPTASRAENTRAVIRAAVGGRQAAAHETSAQSRADRAAVGDTTPSVQLPTHEGRHRSGK